MDEAIKALSAPAPSTRAKSIDLFSSRLANSSNHSRIEADADGSSSNSMRVETSFSVSVPQTPVLLSQGQLSLPQFLAGMTDLSLGPRVQPVSFVPLIAVASAVTPALLVGFEPGQLPLLYKLERALTDVFGFIPDMAADGHVPPKIKRPRLSSTTSSTMVLLDATTASEMEGQTAAPTARFESDAGLLHPSEAGAGWFRQYMHASGTAFVRIDASGVHWIPNKLPQGKGQSGAAALQWLSTWAIEARLRLSELLVLNKAKPNRASISVTAAAAAAANQPVGSPTSVSMNGEVELGEDDLDVDDVTLGKRYLFRRLSAFCEYISAAPSGSPTS
jgi:hypothetical protein